MADGQPSLRFTATPESEAVLALERFRQELGIVDRDIYAWKWAIIAGHNAVQNFMVAALDSPGREQLFSTRYNREFSDWWHVQGGTGPPPPPYMATFLELYRRLGTPCEVFADMEAVNVWRNDFLHFALNTWLVSVRPLPRRFLACLRVVEHCGWSPGRLEWTDASLGMRAQSTWADCVAALERLQPVYES
jgi:hypothetical protein